MKSRTLTCITAMMLCAALAIPVQLTGQEQQKDKKDRRRLHRNRPRHARGGRSAERGASTTTAR